MSLRVALIDSGLHASHPHLRDLVGSCSSWELSEDGEFVEASANNDALGHGTAAAAAIVGFAPGVELISLRIFKDAPSCPFADVLGAIDFAVERGANLINLSLGTTDVARSAELRSRVDDCVERGVPLVSPATWRGLPSYPGALAGCTGVMMDAGLAREAPELRASGERSYWFASPYPRDLPGLPRDANLVGVSMACANLSGFLARREKSAG